MRDRSEEGIALIAVLWMLILLSIIAAVVSLETRSNAHIARNTAASAAARAAAEAGIQRAILDLINSRGRGQLKDVKFPADGTVYEWQFANSTVHISVRDEIGKVDLNKAPVELFAALFKSVGVDSGTAQSLADAIGDFRDSDNFARANGAEEAEYRAAGRASGPKNAPFERIEELQQVLGMTAEIYERVAPELTLYSIAAGAINPTMAGERLTAILRQAGFKYFVELPGTTYSIRAEAEGSNGAVFAREAVVQVIPENRPPVRILDWRRGSSKSLYSALAQKAIQ